MANCKISESDHYLIEYVFIYASVAQLDRATAF